MIIKVKHTHRCKQTHACIHSRLHTSTHTHTHNVHSRTPIIDIVVHTHSCMYVHTSTHKAQCNTHKRQHIHSHRAHTCRHMSIHLRLGKEFCKNSLHVRTDLQKVWKQGRDEKSHWAYISCLCLPLLQQDNHYLVCACPNLQYRRLNNILRLPNFRLKEKLFSYMYNN